MTDVLFVYVTVPDLDVAKTIARCVVEENFAACANILPSMTAIYLWQGSMEENQEALLILKTTTTLFRPLESRIRGLHPYKVPCIVGLPVAIGAADYLNWIHASTRKN